MILHPWKDVLTHMEEKINQGWTVYQQWNCQHCGTKQTMSYANKAYMKGICEECGRVTDIHKNGMNFTAVGGF